MQLDNNQRQLLDQVKQKQAKETEFPKDLKWKHVLQFAHKEEKSGVSADQVMNSTLRKVTSQISKIVRRYETLQKDLADLEAKIKTADALEAAKLSVQYLSKQDELNTLVQHYNSALPQLASELISYISKTSNKLTTNLHEDHKKISDFAQNL